MFVKESGGGGGGLEKYGKISAALLLYLDDYTSHDFAQTAVTKVKRKLLDVCSFDGGRSSFVTLTVVYRWKSIAKEKNAIRQRSKKTTTAHFEQAEQVDTMLLPSFDQQLVPTFNAKTTLDQATNAPDINAVYPYPANAMRNKALKQVQTTHAISLDIDFLPSLHFVKKFIASHNEIDWPGDDFVAVVVPAFEFVQSKQSNRKKYRWLKKRTTKEELRTLWHSKKIDVFEAEQYPSGHSATLSTKWLEATVPYAIEYAYGYEPYVILRAPFPMYDERFVGYGQNKVSSVLEMKLMGYKFYVHPHLFVLHADIVEEKLVDRVVAKERTKKVGEASKTTKDWTVGWSCWHRFVMDLTNHYGSTAMSTVHEPCWVSEYIYPKLYFDRGLDCVSKQGLDWLEQ